MPRKPPPGKSLAEVNPELAKEWHPTKNGDLTPIDVYPSNSLKVWWKCDKGNDHEWQSSLNNRSNGQSCPICSNKKVVLSNCLATTHPELVKEWHPTLNNGKTPFDVIAGSGKKVWWKCPGGEDHEWIAKIQHRSNGSNCPFCSNRKLSKTNSLSAISKEIACEWHFKKNYPLTPEKVIGAGEKKYWWKCDKEADHEWQASIYNRLKGTGCPVCEGLKVVKSNSLIITHPKLSDEWHPHKNKELTPHDLTQGSRKSVWWKCPEGDDHEWKASVFNRTLGTGCPICSGRKVVESNSLLKLRPDIAKDWHPIKNDNLNPNNFSIYSHKRIWWKCEKGDDHEWITSISKRTLGRNCPFCTLTPQSRQELIITFELLTIFKGINPKGFKTKVGGKLWSIDTFIPSLNVGVEFDGAYWHKDKAQLDKVKTKQIEETGLNLIRVRQKPLERLFEDDVMAEKKFDGKQITNDILKQIVKDDGKYAYKLNKRTMDKIDKYLKLEGLQNEKGLDKYIDQILTEKAERKK